VCAVAVLACGRTEPPDAGNPVDDFRSFQIPARSNVRIQTSQLFADLEATAHLTCAGKRIRTWSRADVIEFTLSESCNLDWTLAAVGPPREIKFMVQTASVYRSMTYTVGPSNSPMRLTWVFNAASV
jgi:hypothetical protein